MSCQHMLATCSALVHTSPTVAYYRVQSSYEVGHDGVGIMQAGKDRDDIGAGVGVLFGEGSI
jgi:hypothetical protein